MLRSLVGSEMCIRDSAYGVFTADKNSLVAQEIGVENQYLQSVVAEHPGFCLLYTSDAADDLLCVDLGGRRIIKKKNNSHTQQKLVQQLRPAIS